MSYHLKSGLQKRTAEQNREDKERLVRAGQSHSALVYDGENVVGWCQFGSPTELSFRMRGYSKLDVSLPDWRITCFFVDRNRRGEGVARAALLGALRMIASRGGGVVDAYPINTELKPISNSFLWSGTQAMFKDMGFYSLGNLGTSKVLMRRTVKKDEVFQE